jgi:hypothetical protein
MNTFKDWLFITENTAVYQQAISTLKNKAKGRSDVLNLLSKIQMSLDKGKLATPLAQALIKASQTNDINDLFSLYMRNINKY